MKERLTKTKQRVRDYGEVFTPERIVKQMCNALPDEAWSIGKSILEPACGTGNFLVEILARKLNNCKCPKEGIIALKDIYGVDLLLDNVLESRKRMLDLFISKFGLVTEMAEAGAIIEQQIIQADFLKLTPYIKAYETWETAVNQYRKRVDLSDKSKD